MGGYECGRCMEMSWQGKCKVRFLGGTDFISIGTLPNENCLRDNIYAFHGSVDNTQRLLCTWLLRP